jgi:hypothetical protein
VFGLQERRCGPEAEVKTVLRTEVHAQIFVGPSLQRARGMINRFHPSHIERRRPRGLCAPAAQRMVWPWLSRTIKAKLPIILRR